MHRWPWLLLALALLQPLPAVSQEPAIPNPDWKVARAQFTTAIKDREPVDEVVLTGPPVMELYFFTDLRHLEGRTVTHRWEYEGKLISLKPFMVEGPRWRVFSKKEILPEQVGEWSVTVLDESGWPLHTELFRYEAGAGTPVPAVEAAPVVESAPAETIDAAVQEAATEAGSETAVNSEAAGAMMPVTEPALGVDEPAPPTPSEPAIEVSE